MRDAGRVEGVLPAALTMILDAVLLWIAFLAAYWIRFYSGIWLVPLGIPPLDLYLIGSAVVLAVFLSILYLGGLYADRGTRRLLDLVPGLFRAVVLGSLLVLALAFFLKREAFSRSFFGLFFLGSFFALALSRFVSVRLLRRWRREDRLRLLLIGASPMRSRVLWLARDLVGLALEPVGWLALAAQDDGDPSGGWTSPSPLDAATASVAVQSRTRSQSVTALRTDAGDLPCLGTIADVRRVVAEQSIDRVVLTLPFSQLDGLGEVMEKLENLKVDVQFVPDLYELHVSRMRVEEIAGVPFLALRQGSLSGADRIVKRTFDIVLTGAALLVLSPIYLLLGLLVKLSSPGPVLYHQERVGRDGREFSMLKFRSMRTDAESRSGPTWTVENDPRVTTVGRLLRRWSVDELPQLWNVLRGDMSLVGPRPERRVFVEEFSQKMPRYFERHRVRSGLTGWAQVNGLRGNTSIEARTLYDLYYLENWTLWFDVKILLMTVHHILRGENAY